MYSQERLRLLLKQREPSKIRRRLADFYEAAIDANLPEATRLARTVETWWPAILVSAVSSSTSRSPDRKDQQHERVTNPLKFEEIP